MDTRELKRTAVRRFSAGAVVLGGLFFGTAGTFRYWEAWAYMTTLFLPMGIITAHLLRHDPELMERRLRAKEERTQQRWLQAVGSVLWLTLFSLPGLDRRFGWSEVPVSLVLLGLLVSLGSYLFIFRVLNENRFASRIIQVEEEQTLIDTGPYARVRHPMYLGFSVMMIAAPLALGSWWAMIPALATPLFMIPRILDEEKALVEELEGYAEYRERVRHRLIPGLW